MLADPEDLEALFLEEARTLGALDDPNLAAVLDFDWDAAGRPFFVMEYCCNNLGVLLGEGPRYEDPSRPLPVAQAARYAEQILHGLAHLHHAGIVHRDMKPFNVLITAQDGVKIIDLGLCRASGECKVMPKGVKVGTPYYSAPEQEADPDSVDHRADLYAVGVMLWRMLTGHMPPEGPARQHDNRPSSINPVLDSGWDDFLATALATRPQDRFASAQDMRLALDEVMVGWRKRIAAACVLEEEPQGATPHGTNPRPRSQPRKVRPAEARKAFPVDELLRPLSYVAGDFETLPAPQGESVLRHLATGLVWQKGGSQYGLPMHQAKAYIRSLNACSYGGFADWRLPTVDELLTILVPARSLGDYCLPPAFSPVQRWLWSADRRTYAASWYADAMLGFITSQDHTCAFSVRAVRGAAD